MDDGTAGLMRNALGSAAVLAVVAGIALGLPAIDRSVSGERGVPSGVPYLVGGAISVVPPPGATVDVSRTRPRSSSGTALFRLGQLRIAVQVLPFRGTLSLAADAFRARLTGGGEYRVTAAAEPLVATRGLAGLQGGFAGHGQAGRYAVFVGAGVSVEIMILGPPAAIAGALSVLQESLHSVAVRTGR